MATADGNVVSVGPNGSYGNLVVVDHGYGISTRYGHLSRFAVKPGDHLQRDGAVQADLPRAVHDSHAAPGNFGSQFVIAKEMFALAGG